MAPRRKDRWTQHRYEVQPSAGWYRARRGEGVHQQPGVKTYILRIFDALKEQMGGIVRDIYVLAATLRAKVEIQGSENGHITIHATPGFAEEVETRYGYRLELA